ncbi:exonuclease domain-containing protein [Kitasatospora sp. NPDC094028]
MKWHLGRLAALDFEASDKDPHTARIVSCALIHLGGGMPTERRTWLINPGVPQEPEAIAVHGLTDEYLAAAGQPAGPAIAEIAKAVTEAVGVGIPLVGHNIGSYDLNLLNHELLRHQGAALEEVTGPVTRVIDTMVLDRHAAPFRRRVSATQGAYQLRTAVETYGQDNVLVWDEEQAHGAEYDAHKSAQVAWVMGVIAHKPRHERPSWVHALRNRRGPYDRFDDLACDIDELHRRQVLWAAEDAASLQSWLRSEKAGDKRDPDAVVDGSWPLHAVPAGVTS